MKKILLLLFFLPFCCFAQSHVVTKKYDTGELLSTVTYANAERHGPHQYYWKNGKLWGEGQYEEGLAIGVWKNYYESGELKSEGAFKAGKKEGLWKFYHPNGQLSWEALHQNDQVIKSSPSYNEKGEVMEMQEGC